MSDRGERVDRLLLAQEVAEFLYREAELLDQRRYGDWLALLADDIRYWMPMRRNVKFGEETRELCGSLTAEDRKESDGDQGEPDRHDGKCRMTRQVQSFDQRV